MYGYETGLSGLKSPVDPQHAPSGGLKSQYIAYNLTTVNRFKALGRVQKGMLLFNSSETFCLPNEI